MPANFVYPPTPSNVPDAITAPTPAFKKEVAGVMGSIVFFFIVYALLLLIATGLVVGCVYAGIAIITNIPRLITIVAGIGLIGVGVMVFVFLVKFIFSVSKYDRSHIIEIKEADQPALFGFIRQLTQDTQTKFPRKIYLSADVNACVFYDSSFWSMFFPVKKNLQIGLGLVNALNVSEFKAVMAHEFGHFSQRSMKLGSFVYNVNKIIYNMLYDNSGYASFLQGWANIDGIFALFASITAGIAQGIQSILKGMYGLINKRYMSLSRQMEFHADAVAASVSGSSSLDTALRRIEMAAPCYEITLQKCDELYKQKKISANIYPQQKSVIQEMAEQYKLPIQNGFPVITDEFYQNANTSRVNFKDQWASHPSTEDRIKHLNELAIPAEINEQPAWILFTNLEQWQEKLTAKIYEQVQLPENHSVVTEAEFHEKLKEDAAKYTFPEAYNGFYDNRQPLLLTAEEMEEAPDQGLQFDELFNAESAALSKKINTAANDIAILKAINERNLDAKSFDFDGVKYHRDQAPEIIGNLEKENEGMQQALNRLDKQAVLYFIQKATDVSAENAAILKGRYNKYFSYRKQADAFLKRMNEMLEVLAPVFSGQTMQIETIRSMISQLKQEHEGAFKYELKVWEEEGAFAESPELADRIRTFREADYVYFGETSFMETELRELHSLCNESWAAVSNFIFLQFKQILTDQLAYRVQ
ncbi:MAG: M48 family metalloprotease [Bacteroidetes bacterium]|nr:M48 family metalloprotease [Bacteroidota bacterium]